MADPEQNGVGADEFPEDITELLQHLSQKGIRNLEIAASTLSQLAVSANRPDLMVQVHSLRMLAAFAHQAIVSAGGNVADIRPVPTSEITSTPHDPLKPRTN